MIWGYPYFWKHPFGEMIQFDEHIFQMGWFNHQLEHHDMIFVAWQVFPYLIADA